LNDLPDHPLAVADLANVIARHVFLASTAVFCDDSAAFCLNSLRTIGVVCVTLAN